MFKNTSTPHLLSLVVILVAAVVTLASVHRSNKLVYSETLQALVAGPTAVTPPTLYYVDIFWSNGTCTRIITSDDGYWNEFSPRYKGRGTNGSGCSLAFPTQPKTYDLQLSSAETSTNFSGSDPISYLGSSAGITILKAKLAVGGYFTGDDTSDTFDLATFDAIRKLQAANKIAATGYLDQATLKVLNAINLSARRPFTRADVPALPTSVPAASGTVTNPTVTQPVKTTPTTGTRPTAQPTTVTSPRFPAGSATQSAPSNPR